jgi:2-polyprenyl-3-methyl-5-hydroxy-6-metoxy-1,4-benzoquinol methylase
LFDLGRIEISPAASAALAERNADLAAFLHRHRHGDWGDASQEQQRHNAWALEHDDIIRSIYPLDEASHLMVGTAGDRSTTRVMLEAEFDRREVSAREGYALWADHYDLERNPLIAVEEPLVDAILMRLDLETVLDAGAGTGRYALKLAQRGIAVTAIDPSPEMLAVAQARSLHAGLAVDWRAGSFEDGLIRQAGQFDLALCTLALCHVPDLRRATTELARAVRAGGHVLISDFHPDSVAMGWRTTVDRPEGKFLLPNAPHTRADYLDAIEQAGLTLIEVHDIPVRDIPEGCLGRHKEVIREYGDVAVCLIALAQKTVQQKG